MKQENLISMSLGEIVSADFRTASVLKQAGLDFCCGGRKSLYEACREKNIDPSVIVVNIAEIKKSGKDDVHKFNEWTPSFLADYIVNTHHKYVMKTLPDLLHYTEKIAGVHGERHKELYEVADLFSQLASELSQHMKKEEEVLFPAIKSITEKGRDKDKPLVRAVMKKMTSEHESAGRAMDRVNELTRGYLIPGDACNTYALTMKLLGEFEDDLHTHVHLENNILYPAADKMTE